ncbi:MAG: FAD:protein FMN transferase [Bacteroidales bacterium]|nr:FAD:protein FMN transferase [Bacteroidales bacterium]
MKSHTILFLGIILLACAGCRQEQLNSFEGRALGTIYHITYMGAHDPRMPARVDSVLQEINATFSVFDTNSLLSRINRGKELTPNADLLLILRKALSVSELTNGAFDCTCQPLIELWGFGREKTMASPTPEVVDSVKQFVNYRLVALDGDRLIKRDARVQLNFNAIAKGYAVDKVAELLKHLRYKDFIVEIGGEVVAAGHKNGKPWKVGIQVPTETADGPVESNHQFELTDKAVATSGNYRNYRERGGVRYTHILNPATGRPEETNLLSVTVIAPDCTTADAFATAFMVLGRTRTTEILHQHPELEAWLIYDENGQYKIEHIEQKKANK